MKETEVITKRLELRKRYRTETGKSRTDPMTYEYTSEYVTWLEMQLVKNLHIPNVSNRTWIVTIECGEKTIDWKVVAPNKLAAKATAALNCKEKYSILRCFEYGC